ncbi:hypothetical protein E4T66_16385 [Sinimarinibacterium sp. CAU 1509]|nr:hypothetical protein E4T66_16385 [Sinimarinibacterium sp. CAU 1509]
MSVPRQVSPASLRGVLVLSLLLLASACATVTPPRTAQTAQCRTFFTQIDSAVAKAGVSDGGAARVPGYPYLRADRVLASFADDSLTAEGFGAWVERMRQLDLAARRSELRNLDAGSADAQWQRAEQCGRTLRSLELTDDAARSALRDHVRVRDDYSLAARGFGLYPLAVPFLNLGIKGYHREVRADYARPLAQLDSPGPLLRWTPAPPTSEIAALPTVPLARDALGVPLLSDAQWAALGARYAPQWWIETGGDYDRPGAPVLGADGTPSVDPAEPVVYTLHEFTRFGDQVLPVLVYVIWFSERPSQKAIDSYAGALDGLVWRVVLDPQLQPLVYDTIHPCGCYRYTFPVQALTQILRGGFWQEPVLFPQGEVPADAVALRIQSETHYLRRVVAPALATGDVHHYTLRPYADLLSLPAADGARRSLFDTDGIVAGTQRGERWWLWITGVPDPGAMRQWGRHATSFVGRSHFDDARFLEQNFSVPDWAKTP